MNLDSRLLIAIVCSEFFDKKRIHFLAYFSIWIRIDFIAFFLEEFNDGKNTHIEIPGNCRKAVHFIKNFVHCFCFCFS